MPNINKYVTDIIKDDYKSWCNESVFIDCPTGAGKTYFIINVLAKYAANNNKSILYLCNREKLYNKINFHIKQNQITNVYVFTYQALQEQLKSGMDIKYRDYLIADEAHYFLSDATFNVDTDLSYYYVRNATSCVKVFMSATSTSLYNILLEEGILSENRCYRLQPDYSYVDKIYFYKKRNHTEIIKYLLNATTDKIVYFSSSNEKWLNAVHDFESDANRICSIHTKNEEMRKLNQPDCIQTINDDYITFEKRLLISTKTLDCGIDLKNREIKHIICDISDFDSAMQCLGRKRVLDENDTVNFYIRDYSSNELILNLQRKQTELEPMDLFLHNMDEFIEKYDKREMYYGFYTEWAGDQLPHVNQMKYHQLRYEIKLLQQAIDTSYRRLFINFMGEIEVKISEIPFTSVVEKEKLLLFLEENKDKELSKDEKETLISLCNLRDSRNRQQKSIGMLNEYFKERRMGYVILNKRTKDVRYWYIAKLW